MPAGFGEETIELPGKDEDVSVHMKELQQYEEKLSKPAEKAWDSSKGIETHPLFFFIWEEVPSTDNSAFLSRLNELLGQDWILDAGIEKSSENTSCFNFLLIPRIHNLEEQSFFRPRQQSLTSIFLVNTAIRSRSPSKTN